MLHIYYGMGKGKTSTLNGSVLRAKGAGLKVLYAQFLKGIVSSEEVLLIKNLDHFKKVQSIPKFVIQMNDKEKTKTQQEVDAALNELSVIGHNYDVLLFDEIIDLTVDNVNLVSVEKICKFLTQFKDKEVLITGHYLPKKLKNIADLITKYDAEKHYYNQGVKARRGFEF